MPKYSEILFAEGTRIRNLRKSHKLSQAELGEAIGCAKNTVCSWENGRDVPQRDFVIAMAQLFNVSTDYIFFGSTAKPIPEKPESSQLIIGKAVDDLIRQLASQDPNIPALFTKQFSENELKILLSAFQGVVAIREEIERLSEQQITSINTSNKVGLENGENNVG